MATLASSDEKIQSGAFRPHPNPFPASVRVQEKRFSERVSQAPRFPMWMKMERADCVSWNRINKNAPAAVWCPAAGD
jgi:hypothetical protein